MAGEEAPLPILQQEDRVFLVGVLGLVVKEDQEVLGEEAVQVFRTPLEGAEEQPWEDLSLS